MASVSWISPPVPGFTSSSASKIAGREHVAAEHGQVDGASAGAGFSTMLAHLAAAGGPASS